MHTEHLLSIPTEPLSVSNLCAVVGFRFWVAVRQVMDGFLHGTMLGDSRAKGFQSATAVTLPFDDGIQLVIVSCAAKYSPSGSVCESPSEDVVHVGFQKLFVSLGGARPFPVTQLSHMVVDGFVVAFLLAEVFSDFPNLALIGLAADCNAYAAARYRRYRYDVVLRRCY